MAAKVRKKSVAEKNPRTAGRRKARTTAKSGGQSRFGSFFLPMFLSICLLICLGVLGFLGLQSVTASKFFQVKAVDVRGTERASREDIARIASGSAEKSGVWNADLAEIKAKIERLPFVKTASVSRVLPDGLRVNVVERVPIAIVKLSSGDSLVDNEAVILARVEHAEDGLPIPIVGWDESKTERAVKDNLERVKVYQRMTGAWKEAGLVSRVINVDLADLRDMKAISEDSGNRVTIGVGQESFAQNLKNGISAIAGKGDQFDGVDLVGSNMILSSRKNPAVAQSDSR